MKKTILVLGNEKIRIEGENELFDIKVEIQDSNEEFEGNQTISNSTYKCKKCDESFIFKTQLNDHMSRFHPGKYKCNECSKSFTKSSTIKTHIAHIAYCTI